MRFLMYISIACFLHIYDQIQCSPVDSQTREQMEKVQAPDSVLNVEYKKYLGEVVAVLENDESFKSQLDSMNTDSKVDGDQIAYYLQFANKNTRTKLDELKRMEIRRLKDLHKQLMTETADGRQKLMEKTGKRISPKAFPKLDVGHIDEKNPESFGQSDLKKLISKTLGDLRMVDKKRKNKFKEYEMNKENEYRKKLKSLDEAKAAEFRRERMEAINRHRNHSKMNHPGSRKQFEEVWDKIDLMKPENFNPKLFFKIHDIDGNGYLSIDELEAILQRELDKVYDFNNPDDDMVERSEEMNRMREHVFTEVDSDQDGQLSYEEFLASMDNADANKDETWETLDGQEIFNEDEFLAFQRSLEQKSSQEDNSEPVINDDPSLHAIP